ncbi:MAG: hypothetical protein LH606_06860 [Cytophagaceae bacterium]|nr:hypothetical protein [Cytophagaceae bacterium]
MPGYLSGCNQIMFVTKFIRQYSRSLWHRLRVIRHNRSYLLEFVLFLLLLLLVILGIGWM